MAPILSRGRWVFMSFTRVIESKNAAYSVGSLHVAKFGWRSHTVADPTLEEYEVRPVPDMGGLAPSLCLGICGMPGWVDIIDTLDNVVLVKCQFMKRWTQQSLCM